MKRNYFPLLIPACLCLLVLSCKKEVNQETTESATSSAASKKKATQAPTMTVFATGLNNPRGLKFGDDGYLYVAEAGVGGTQSTAGQCPQIPAPMGPYTGSPDGGRVSKIDMSGNRTTVSSQLPSSQSATGDIEGPADVAFLNNQLYVLLSGVGCPFGVPQFNNGVYRINANGSTQEIANLGAWSLANPPAKPSEDFNPLGVWYSMIAKGKSLYALDANQGRLVEVGLNGSTKLVTDMSASVGHIVPTALADRGTLYMGNLGPFPIQGNSAIYKITPSGHVKEVVSGFSAILGLVIDQQSRMYVLEMTSGAMFPTPGTGRIVRVDPNGSKEVIISGLSFPTGMTQGPDGNLYVSNWGFGKGPGGGEIVKVDLHQ
jgi:hypothetical protein